MRRTTRRIACLLAVATLAAACATTAPPPAWEMENPLVPLPEPPLGIDGRLSDLPEPPTPERVQLGRWLFYDARISANGSISCGSCHRPESGFSEPTPVSTGIGGRQGRRKSPAFVNAAFAFYERTCMSGNSPWDRPRRSPRESGSPQSRRRVPSGPPRVDPHGGRDIWCAHICPHAFSNAS